LSEKTAVLNAFERYHDLINKIQAIAINHNDRGNKIPPEFLLRLILETKNKNIHELTGAALRLVDEIEND